MISTSTLPPEIVALRMFGSRVRGDARVDSDWDVLAVVDGGSAQVRRSVDDIVRAELPKADLSFYAASTIRRMFASGHLFAWHVYHESRKLIPASVDLLDSLGIPSPYTRATEEIAELRSVLDSVEPSLAACPERATYEAGLLFVCCRNIALSASWFSASGLDFSRYAPFHLQIRSVRFPLTHEEYDACVRARLAGTRGMDCEPLPAAFVAEVASKAAAWAGHVFAEIRELVYERSSA
jgi:hypothetical protein